MLPRDKITRRGSCLWELLQQALALTTGLGSGLPQHSLLPKAFSLVSGDKWTASPFCCKQPMPALSMALCIRLAQRHRKSPLAPALFYGNRPHTCEQSNILCVAGQQHPNPADNITSAIDAKGRVLCSKALRGFRAAIYTSSWLVL